MARVPARSSPNVFRPEAVIGRTNASKGNRALYPQSHAATIKT